MAAKARADRKDKPENLLGREALTEKTMPNRLIPGCLVLLCLAMASAASAFDLKDVEQQAKKLAEQPYREPSGTLPKELQSLTYDQYRDIRFNPEKALWRSAKLPFEVMFFHQGSYFNHPVRISEIRPGGVRNIRFSTDFFDYGVNAAPRKTDGLGFAGFRVHYPINTPKYKDEVAVFLGASYFRILGKNQHYGLSARGLAVDTALASGEEFPRFTRFWLLRPTARAKELTIYALLDSRRATGAYQFVVKPGVETVTDVKARVFLRRNVSKLAVAPLTSMFFFGAGQRPEYEDYRTQVHDSDGLSIHSGTGEWIWRPLQNPARLLVTSFALDNPQGFGLMQRYRKFDDYQDLEALYEKRPSAWVEPLKPWGAGRVELVQIPTPDETNDNIVAYWVPDDAGSPSRPVDIAYRVRWQMENETRPPLSWVTQTRRGRSYAASPDDSIGFIIDFDGPTLSALKPEIAVEGVVTADENGEIIERVVQRNTVSGGYRLSLKVRRKDEEKPVELRAFLRGGQQTLSETWSHILLP